MMAVMVGEAGSASNGSTVPPDEATGAFPFELTDRADESRYLVWIRNHSNYMAVRGFADYFRSIGVLLRGIILNFLIVLPALLLVSIALAYSHHWMLGHPYRITLTALAVCVLTILLFPIVAQIFKIYSYRRGLATGSESTVKQRDFSEKLFGRLLILVLVVALLESLPWLLEMTRDYVEREKIGWRGGLSAILAALAFLSGSGKFISALGGAKKKIMIGAVGLLGLLIPLAVILIVTHYLLYGVTPSPYALLLPIIAIGLFVCAIFLVVLLGAFLRNFTATELATAVGLLLLALTTLVGSAIYLTGKAQADSKATKAALVELLEPVNRLADGISGFDTVIGVDADQEQLFAEFQAASRKLTEFSNEVNQRPRPAAALRPPNLKCDKFPGCLPAKVRQLKNHIEPANFKTYWDGEQAKWRDYRDEVVLTMPLAAILVDLKEEPEARLEVPRQKLAALARADFAGAPPVPSEQEVIPTVDLKKAISPTTYVEEADSKRDDILQMGVDQLTEEQLLLLYNSTGPRANDLIARLKFGEYGGLDRDESYRYQFRKRLTETSIDASALFVGFLAVLIWLGSWLSLDVNLTSIHGLYRDRLAAAFLVGRDTKGDVDVEEDLDLHLICQYDRGSTAPYHLVNVALNLQASKELRIRDRQSDMFFFSKRFIGGERTGYCRSELMEQVFPQMSLATAMAISAGAAAPNMGRATSPLLVALMTLLNVRLGYWMPNPGLLEENRELGPWGMMKRRLQRHSEPGGFKFSDVFAVERHEIAERWRQAYKTDQHDRAFAARIEVPSTEHGLVGLAFSGGGIRSAAINLGITQVLHKHGVFQHVDYMSTVSGGGYLGSSISTLMRAAEPEDSATQLQERSTRYSSPVAGKIVAVVDTPDGGNTLTIEDEQSGSHHTVTTTRFDRLSVKAGDDVRAGQALVRMHQSISDRFRWRVRPVAFLREMISKLDETHRWVNLSDGGHIENLAAIELLRRRCKYIIVGDGEADPQLHFGGLATLLRTAYLDLGIEIEINLDALRLQQPESGESSGTSAEHWAAGTIRYPGTGDNDDIEEGYLLYLKSSFSGDENEIIREFRHRNPTFPHQTTADQFFDEGQFEAYRALGEHIAGRAVRERHVNAAATDPATGNGVDGTRSYTDLDSWFKRLVELSDRRPG